MKLMQVTTSDVAYVNFIESTQILLVDYETEEE
jgi:hypothetical protein